MKNFEIARLFDQMADVLEIKGDNPFRIRAYRRAAQNLETLTEDVEALARQGRLEEIPGVGADLAGKISEYLGTGRIKEIDAARRGIPHGVVELMNVPGIGPKTARLLYEREGVTSMSRVATARRAWLTKDQIVYTWPLKRLVTWTRSTRRTTSRRPLPAIAEGAGR